MKRFIYLFLTTALLAQALLIGTAAADVWRPFGGVDCSDRGKNSSVCKEGGNTEDPISGADGLIMNVANFISVIAGIAAVIIIVLAGLRFVQAGGKSEDIAAARRMLIYALVGLVVIILARTLVGFALNIL